MSLSSVAFSPGSGLLDSSSPSAATAADALRRRPREPPLVAHRPWTARSSQRAPGTPPYEHMHYIWMKLDRFRKFMLAEYWNGLFSNGFLNTEMFSMLCKINAWRLEHREDQIVWKK
jgi:hypothetical protein